MSFLALINNANVILVAIDAVQGLKPGDNIETS